MEIVTFLILLLGTGLNKVEAGEFTQFQEAGDAAEASPLSLFL